MFVGFCFTASAAGVPAVTITVDFGRNQFGNQRRKTIVLPVGPEIFDRDVAAFFVAGFTQAFAKRVEQIGFQRRRGVTHEADEVCFLLRVRGERPSGGPGGGRSTHQGNELAPSHSDPTDSGTLL
jgi:hypothetical protein